MYLSIEQKAYPRWGQNKILNYKTRSLNRILKAFTHQNLKDTKKDNLMKE